MGYIDDVQRKLIKGGGYDLTSIEGRSAAAETKVAFGSAVVMGEFDDGTNYGNSCSVANKDNANLPRLADGSLDFIGVSHRTHALPICPEPLEAPYGDGDTAYSKVTEAVAVTTQGRISVLLHEDVTKQDKVSFSINGAVNNFDTWGKTVDGDNQEVKTARWFQGGKAGELAVLELNGV